MPVPPVQSPEPTEASRIREYTNDDERKRIHFIDRSPSEDADAKHLKDDGKGQGADGSSPVVAAAGGRSATEKPKRPTSRRKKSIRIILDDEELNKDTMRSESSLNSALERKIRFEDSPLDSGNVTPLDSKGSGPSETSYFEDKLRLLAISDSMTGLLLFNCLWNWRKGSNHTMIGSLVQSFYQFARDVNDAGPVYVSFELPSKRNHTHHRHTPRKNLQNQRPQTSMSMVSCRDNTCVVSLFFDDRCLPVTNPETESLLRCYIEAVRERFTAAYADKIEPLRPQLKGIADGKKQEVELLDIQRRFEAFDKPANELRDKLLPGI